MSISSRPQADADATEPAFDPVDPFARVYHATSLREQAARCRRLANAISRGEAQTSLFSLAREFESQADWIDPLTTVAEGRPADRAVEGDYVPIRRARSG